MISVEMIAFTKNDELTSLRIKDGKEGEVIFEPFEGKPFKVSLSNLMSVLKMFEEVIG